MFLPCRVFRSCAIRRARRKSTSISQMKRESTPGALKLRESPGRIFRSPKESRIAIGSWWPASNSCARDRLSTRKGLTQKRPTHEPDPEFASVPGRHAYDNARDPVGRRSSNLAYAAHGRSERHHSHRNCSGVLSGCNLRSSGEPVGEKDRESIIQVRRSAERKN